VVPETRRDRERREWLRQRADELAAMGLPLRVFETPARWDDFLENGHLHFHEDATHFSFEELDPAQLRALHLFLEREHGAAERIPDLLGFLRVRRAPELRLGAAPTSPHDALAWLASRGAHPWLVRHHELVLEAAEEIVASMARFSVELDRERVLVGAALHDAGKIAHAEEMSAPGHAHESEGERMLLAAGFDPAVARVCVTHAEWSEPRATIEDRLVALADALWKGKRDEELERALVAELAAATRREEWDVYAELDELCEGVARSGPRRLARSHV
jgi:hypothetical protein